MQQNVVNAMSHVPEVGKGWFSAETYVGNWYEETVRNTLKRDEFLKKRECGDLSIQRTQTMVDLLLKPVDLTVNNDDYLHYGDRVQIVSPGPTCELAVEMYPFKRNYCKLTHLALSCSVPPSVVSHSPYLSTDSIISASPLLYPVVRNSFIIERPDCPSDTKTVINYGDVFRIRTFQTQYFPLYLFSAPGIRLHCGSTHSAKPKVRLSDLLTSDTLWTAHPLDPFEKLKMELGVPIPLKKRLLIKHNGSGHNLSIETNFPVLTYFENELEVTVDSKYDRVRKPTFENLWYFDTERGWPQPSDCDKEFEKQARFSAEINVNAASRSAADTAKEEEAERKEAEGGYDYDESADDQQDIVTMQRSEAQDQEIENVRQGMAQMPALSSNGQRLYDSRTGPQPNAHSYRVTANDPFFPNKKWNCGDTDCCNPRPQNAPQEQPAYPKCEPCECVEPVPPGESPHARISINRLLL